MMFIIPENQRTEIPRKILSGLPNTDHGLVWLIAADTAYFLKHGPRLVATARQHASRSVHFHFHIIREAQGTPAHELLPALSADELSLSMTERVVDLANTNSSQRKALFASERFLLLGGVLQEYKRPVLVTDIDILCLKDPRGLLPLTMDHDLAITNFRNAHEAWERYAATALLINPTRCGIAFATDLSSLLLAILRHHPQPWFADQIALFRLLEAKPVPVKHVVLEDLLTDSSPPNPEAFFEILHASWEAGYAREHVAPPNNKCADLK